MAYSNGIFDRMMEEAMDKVACGDKGWKDVPTNTLLLACFCHLNKNITRSVSRPIWFFAGAVGCGVVWLLIRDIFF